MAITTPRTQAALRVGVAWQAAKGTPADAADAVLLVCSSVETNPGRVYVDQQGSVGSRWEIDSLLEVAKEPSATLSLYGDLQSFGLLLEAALMGQPTSSAVTEAGDTGAALSSWAFTGVRPGHNTEYAAAGEAKLYVTLTDGGSGTGHTVSVYSDSARSALVAEGTCDDSQTCTLAEENSSGLSGTVAVGTVSATNAAITLTVTGVTFAQASTLSRFFTLFRDTGAELETFGDCAVRSLKVSAADREAVVVEAEIVARSYSLGATALTGQPPFLAAYAHQHTTMRSAVTGTPVSESPSGLSWSIENELGVPLASAATPTDIFLRSTRLTLETQHISSSEAQVLTASQGTWQSVDVTYALGGRSLVVLFDQAQVMDTVLPGFSDREVGAVLAKWAVREDLASGTAPIIITMQP